MIEAARRVTGREIPVKEEPRRPGDPAQLVASSEKIRAELGWEPEKDLEAMIADAWAWRQARPDGYGNAASASGSTASGGSVASSTTQRSGSAAASSS